MFTLDLFQYFSVKVVKLTLTCLNFKLKTPHNVQPLPKMSWEKIIFAKLIQIFRLHGKLLKQCANVFTKLPKMIVFWRERKKRKKNFLLTHLSPLNVENKSTFACFYSATDIFPNKKCSRNHSLDSWGIVGKKCSGNC